MREALLRHCHCLLLPKRNSLSLLNWHVPALRHPEICLKKKKPTVHHIRGTGRHTNRNLKLTCCANWLTNRCVSELWKSLNNMFDCHDSSWMHGHAEYNNTSNGDRWPFKYNQNVIWIGGGGGGMNYFPTKVEVQRCRSQKQVVHQGESANVDDCTIVLNNNLIYCYKNWISWLPGRDRTKIPQEQPGP